jgi:hypothetical protein
LDNALSIVSRQWSGGLASLFGEPPLMDSLFGEPPLMDSLAEGRRGPVSRERTCGSSGWWLFCTGSAQKFEEDALETFRAMQGEIS